MAQANLAKVSAHYTAFWTGISYFDPENLRLAEVDVTVSNGTVVPIIIPMDEVSMEAINEGIERCKIEDCPPKVTAVSAVADPPAKKTTTTPAQPLEQRLSALD
jgi:hypothetical protein